jgi:uncharacterized membrane protein YbhN (UPF0104 family)
LKRALIFSTVAAVVVYIAIAAYAGAREVAGELASFAWPMAALALALAALNYFLRFLKWQLYLNRLGIEIPVADSAKIFLSGFSLTVTPGKVGEVLKSYLLREAHGVPMARSAPTVIAERLTDLIACVALALGGVGVLGGGERLLWAAAAGVASFIALASWRRFVEGCIALLPARVQPKLREFYGAMHALVRPAPLAAATLLSVAAWASECVAFWVVLRGFPGAAASLKLCTFIYAAMTLAGALSFLPGGLGVQEGGMIGLLVALASGVSKPRAAAATFVTRACTLWFAVAVGLVALTLAQKRARVDLASLRAAK